MASDKTGAVARESFDFWIAAGLPFASAVAMVGSEQGETAFDTRAVGDRGHAYSILQWHWEPRGRRIHEGCGIDVRTCSHAEALKAALWEFETIDPASWRLLTGARTIDEAIHTIVYRVENSRNKTRDVVKRTLYAKRWADVFAASGTVEEASDARVSATQAAAVRYAVADHVLLDNGKPVAQAPSPNHGGRIEPKLLVMHYTATPDAAGAIRTLCSTTNPLGRVSCHLVLDRDGTIHQLLPLDIAGWHVGRSAYHGTPGCNDFAIGIEMVNAGVLNGKPGAFTTAAGNRRIADTDALIHAPHPVTGGVANWHRFTHEQIEASIAIGAAILIAYPSIADVVGHENVATPTGRKVDPGPAYPLQDARLRMMEAAGRAPGPFALVASAAHLTPLA